MKTINFKNESIKLHGTYAENEYYTSDIPEVLIDCLSNNFILKNDRFTVYEDMAYSEVEFTTDSGEDYIAYVCYDLSHGDNPDTYAEFLVDESNFRIRQA